MSKTTTVITREQLDAMRATFAALPPKQKTTFTGREAIAEMETDIRRACDKLGYSVADIARMLQQSGHPMEESTLRSYLRKLANAPSKKKPVSPRKGTARMPLLDLSSEVQARRAQSEAPPLPEVEPEAEPAAVLPTRPQGEDAHVEADTKPNLPTDLPGRACAALEEAQDG